MQGRHTGASIVEGWAGSMESECEQSASACTSTSLPHTIRTMSNCNVEHHALHPPVRACKQAPRPRSESVPRLLHGAAVRAAKAKAGLAQSEERVRPSEHTAPGCA
eukprot:1151186-Pelagomonas_calceolata.AAC.4